MQEHRKKSTLELLSYLTAQERAELDMLATPPSSASYCLTIHKVGNDHEAETQEAITEYVHRSGYAPPVVVHVVFVATD